MKIRAAIDRGGAHLSHAAAFSERLPSALRAEENADKTTDSITTDLLFSLLFPIEQTLHQLSELKQTLTDLRRPWRMMREPHFPLKKDSAATFSRRRDAVLLAINSAGNKIPFFHSCASSPSQRRLHKRPGKHTIPRHDSKPGFIQQHGGRRGPARLAAPALSSTERPEKARRDAERGAAKQIKCQRSSKVTAIFGGLC